MERILREIGMNKSLRVKKNQKRGGQVKRQTTKKTG
jgi:hypothetical protein